MKSYTHFTLSERNCLQQLLSEGKSYREIAGILDRSPSTISREVKRNYSYGKSIATHGELLPSTLFAGKIV